MNGAQSLNVLYTKKRAGLNTKAKFVLLSHRNQDMLLNQQMMLTDEPGSRIL